MTTITTLPNPNILVSSSQLFTVFLVEDYQLARLGLISYFEQTATIKIIGEAANGSDALRGIRTLQPDVVLMDLSLPDMSGVEATQQIKAFNADVKVVILTFHESKEDIKDAFEAGADAYCLKDIELARLAEVMQSVVQGNRHKSGNSTEIYERFLKEQPVQPNTSIPPASFSRNYQLTHREEQVLKLLVQGKNNVQIAMNLVISVHTAKAHVCNVMQKLCVKDRLQAAVKAVREGLV